MPNTFKKFNKNTLPFLREAGSQIKNEWLDDHESEYDQHLRGPFVALVEKLKKDLSRSAPDYHFPSRNLAKIKKMANRVTQGEPVNKDWVSVSVSRPQVSRFEHYPHLFFGILPDQPQWNGIFITGGLFMPTSAQMKKVRLGIAKDAKPFHTLFADAKFKKNFSEGFSKRQIGVRTPLGFAADHPDIEWLKLKNFMVERRVSVAEFTSSEFFDHVEADFHQLLKFNRLLESLLDADS
jgi:uncharacterized protein (TIGR02453 family)